MQAYGLYGAARSGGPAVFLAPLRCFFRISAIYDLLARDVREGTVTEQRGLLPESRCLAMP